ncbi:MAG: hypothetical protein JRJ83_14280 [Deltaproteobacteria bacterium]|nr:hypothetical protein [Deltaproteobacteria bacterium]
MSSGEPEKDKLFQENGYRYSNETLCFVNHKAGKIFTRAYVNDSSINALQTNIHSIHDSSAWKVFYNANQAKFIQNILLVHGEKPK